MAGRKRKAAPTPVKAASKKARVEEDIPTAEPESTTSSRPKRTSVGTPQYNFTRPRHISEKQADNGPKAKAPSVPSTDLPKRRGRPPKVLPSTHTPPESSSTARVAARGRPALKDAPAKSTAKQPLPATDKEAPAPKRRGRPPKAGVSNTTKKSGTTKSKVADAVLDTSKGTIVPRKRGRPPKSLAVQWSAIPKYIPIADDSGADDSYDEESEEELGDRQYWLMKAEPNDRFENGINVKFSIDDLAAAQTPEPWDGVRNYVARNNMRAMRKGDLAFFYHSNCPVPGIVGVMRIVEEHTPDKSAFDPVHPYYDPKSDPDNPKWDCVHVEFVKKFDTQITLKMLQENKSRSGPLADMQLLRLGRLSVSVVEPKEWRHILEMAGEHHRIGEDEDIADLNKGYEAETDGEVDGGPNEELNGMIANGFAEDTAKSGEVLVPTIEAE